MNKNKLNVTQVGDMNAAMKKWNMIVSNGDDRMSIADFKHYGGIVFAYAHKVETTQLIELCFFDEKNLKDINVKEMADILRGRHAGISSIRALDDKFDIEVFFVFNEQQTEIETILCVDFIINGIHVITDKSKLEEVLKVVMRFDTPFPSMLRSSAN